MDGKLDYAGAGLGHPRTEYLARKALRILAKALVSLLILVMSLMFLVALSIRQTDRGYGPVESLKSDEMKLEDALDNFRLDCGRYPAAEEGWHALLSRPAGVNGWNGP